MGAITLAALPRYLDKWGVPYRLTDGWLTRGRKSGGFDQMLGIGIHHGASAPNSTLASAERYCTEVATDRPIGNGTFSRDKDGPILLLWAGLAANTLGKGGPRWSTRGVIPMDSGNARAVNYEAENDGVGEPWSDAMCDLMVLTCCATLDWARNETPGGDIGPGDIFGHFEWAPGRKFDPAGPSRFNGHQAGGILWDMDTFRGAVFMRMIQGAPGEEPTERPDPRPAEPLWNGVPTPVLAGGAEGGDAGALVDVLRFWQWVPANTANEWKVTPTIEAGIGTMQSVLGLTPTRIYDGATARAYSDFAIGMVNYGCTLPAASKVGDHSTDVFALQVLLNRSGWYPYKNDGIYGPRTQQGVQQWQRQLRDRGRYAGPIDGAWSLLTRASACQG